MARAEKRPLVSGLDDTLMKTLAKELEKKGIRPENATEILKDFLNKAVQELSPRIFSTLKENMPAVLEKDAKTRTSFEKRALKCSHW